MSDMAAIIQPKSDQLNADSLLDGPKTIKITKVTVTPSVEQPCTVHYEGEDGRPYKPCKSMARVMVLVWGGDSKAYVGKSMTLYHDPEVKWGGMKVGGIRISHMSDMKSNAPLMLTVTRGKKAPYSVKPLAADVVPLKVVDKGVVQTDNLPDAFDLLAFMGEVDNHLSTACDADELQSWWDERKPDRMKAGATDKAAAIKIAETVKAKIAALRGEGEV